MNKLFAVLLLVLCVVTAQAQTVLPVIPLGTGNGVPTDVYYATRCTNSCTITLDTAGSAAYAHAVYFAPGNAVPASITVAVSSSPDNSAYTTQGTSTTINGDRLTFNLAIRYVKIVVTVSPSSAITSVIYTGSGTNTGQINVASVTAAANANQVAASSDTVMCATDIGCVVKTLGADPCIYLAKSTFNVRVASSSLTQLIAAQSSNKTYICSLKIQADGTGETASVVEAAHSSTACDGSKTAVEGNTTAASGVVLAANGGFAWGNGLGTLYVTSATNHEVCALDNSTNVVHFTGTYVAAP
jgi:hypothetical protein